MADAGHRVYGDDFCRGAHAQHRWWNGVIPRISDLIIIQERQNPGLRIETNRFNISVNNYTIYTLKTTTVFT